MSVIAPHSYEASHSSQCDKEGSSNGRGRWWSTETRCRRDPSVEEHVGDFGDMKRVTANWQEVKGSGESLGSKAVDEDDGENEEDDDDDTVASAITSANSVAAVAVPAITTSPATVTACCHAASKSDSSAEIVNKDKLYGTSTIHGCGKFTSSTALRNVLFHASPAESKRLPKLRKPQESMGTVTDEEQQTCAWQSLTLPVIPEPSIDQPHSSPPGDQPVKIEIPIESD